MGSKITIDSATMMNKGLEVIEAYWLFNLPKEKIEVIIHPQSIIHSMVEFNDGSIKAQLSTPDMKLPILYALTFPERYHFNAVQTDFKKINQLTFFEPDFDKFACLKIAYDVIGEGGTAFCVLNAANEVAVDKFLSGKIKFNQIPEIINDALNTINNIHNADLETIVEFDFKTRDFLTKNIVRILNGLYHLFYSNNCNIGFYHEFGHFAAAKLSKMRVDVFAIGFGKRLFGFNKINGFTFGDLPKDFDTQGFTDYRLSLLPLGGYVKIAGMVDESFDTKFAGTEPKPYEFRAKKTLPKLFVITAGVMMNLSLTILIFWGINFFQGKEIAKSTTIAIVDKGTIAEKAGFQSLDKILSVNNVPVKDWDEVVDRIFIDNQSSDVKLNVERNGIVQFLDIKRKFITENSQNGFFLFPYPTQAIVVEVLKNSPCTGCGYEKR